MTKNIHQNTYKIEQQFVRARTGDYAAAKKAIAPWSFSTKDCEGNGNLCMCVDFSGDRPVIRPEWVGGDSVALYRAISSSLLMYRLATLFGGTITTRGQDGYKCVWTMGFQHSSGEMVWFGEHKGAATFWTRFISGKGLPRTFKRDLTRLLDVLTSENCAHPYDGLVAGSVA